ncbi:MAG: FtsX-like permease family protein [Mariprofundaceae bacterium]
MLIALAWRNIERNIRRSLITAFAIALGLAALLFLWGFNDGIHNNMMRNLQQVIVGSVQIHAADFFKRPKLTRDIDHISEIDAVLDELKIKRRALRIRSFALAAGEDTSRGLMMLGVDADQEVVTTRIAKKVTRGRFVNSADTRVCVLGGTTAENLRVTLGDDVILLAEDRFGSLAAEKFELVGIMESGEMGIDRGLAIVPMQFMQQMLGMEGRYSEVVLQLEKDELESVTAALRAQLEPQGYEVLRWYDMYPVMKEWVDLENGFYYIFLSIVLLIVAAGVMNTVLMSMLERVREFGVMMALGCGRMRIASIVLIESMILGTLGVVSGTGMGMALIYYYQQYGIDMSQIMESVERFYIDTVIYTEIDTDHLLITVVSVLISAALASIIPAWRAARLEPVEAIHHLG